MISNCFLCALPGGLLEANRTVVSEWERFTLIPRNHLGLQSHPNLTGFLDVMERAYNGSKTTREIIGRLLQSPSKASGIIVEALWPLLTLSEFDSLALSITDDPLLASKLSTMFPGDFFAVTALPALKNWILENRVGLQPTKVAVPFWKRLFQPTAPSTLAPAKRVDPPGEIGPELDHLAVDGFDGKLTSFAHACNASLRRSVNPVRPVAIVATARSEGIYLLEWIAYHRSIGVEKFYLYSNNNDDASDELLSALHQANVIHWTKSSMAAGTSAQNKAYGHALNVQSSLLDYRWALFIDVDEFVVFDPTRFADITSFARWHETRQTDAVGLNWVMVGSSSQANWNELPLTQRNLNLEPSVNPHIKVMLSPKCFIQSHPHFPFAETRRTYTFRLADGSIHDHRLQPAGSYHAKAFSDRPTDVDACIYHYYHKSVDEFLWKSSRNRGDFPMSHEITFQSLDKGAAAYFLEQHSAENFRLNDRIRDCAPELAKEMEQLRELPGVRTAEDKVRGVFKSRIQDIRRQFLQSQRLVELEGSGESLRLLIQQSDDQLRAADTQ